VIKNTLFDKLTVKPNKAVKVQLPGLNTLNPDSFKIFLIGEFFADTFSAYARKC